MNPEQRALSITGNTIYHLIFAQAGSLSKAFLEYIMNSVDAGATEIQISLGKKEFTYSDNGCGITTREEVEKYFDVFGFDHATEEELAKGRTYGQFGIGRAQMWAFARTLWRSGRISMNVDIKTRGLNYEFQEDCDAITGMTITGSFYEPMNESSVINTVSELTELALYAPIPVIVNGARISKDPTQEKWSVETDDAWILIKDTKTTLDVYNQGIHVRSYNHWNVGVGGVVVTKPGRALKLNMARTDILTSQCDLWASIRKFLVKTTKERVERSARLTDQDLDTLAFATVNRSADWETLKKARYIRDVSGRGLTLDDLCHRAAEGIIITVADKEGSPYADRAHQRRIALVLSRRTLTRFHVDSVTALIEIFKGYLGTFGPGDYTQQAHLRALNNAKIFDDLHQAAPDLRGHYDLTPAPKLTPDEKAVLYALTKVNGAVRHLAHQSNPRPTGGYIRTRQLRAGDSDVAQAWTNSSTLIAFRRDTLTWPRQTGLSGMMRLVCVMLHEYQHDTGSMGSDLHDTDFYRRMHDTIIESPELHRIGIRAFRKYVAYCKAHNIKLLRMPIDSLDVLDLEANALGVDPDEEDLSDVGEFHAALEEPVEQNPQAS